MKLSDLHYPLPDELIARYPASEREAARLMVVEAAGRRHAHIRDLPELLPAGALLVVNDTRVLPARLFGHKPSGGRVELLLVSRCEASGDDDPRAEVWRAMARANRPLRPGTTIRCDGMQVTFGPRDEAGLAEVTLLPDGDESVASVLERCGELPLPPYLQRRAETLDRERYQTVYAREAGAVAAPTAGLHLSEALIAQLGERGIDLVAVTLHVGPGTFRPVEVDDLADHVMHREHYAVDEAVAQRINEHKARGGPVIAVGTTVVRTLESAQKDGRVVAQRGETDLFIKPGHELAVVDGLLTNFHLPGSTLLALVFAFAGRDRILAAYADAISRRYRFFSYGDAMLIPSRLGAA